MKEETTDPSSCVTSNRALVETLIPGASPLFTSIQLPDGSQVRLTDNEIERFWAYVELSRSGCWQWTGHGMSIGYGSFAVRTFDMYPHRLTHMFFLGPIPAEYDIDHLCRNRRCCRPAHLEAVTHRENVLRSPIALAAVNARKTHCIRGHEFSTENTIYQGEWRQCLICTRWREKAAHARRHGLPIPEEPGPDASPVPRPGHKRAQGTCPHGHPYDEANTYIDPSGWKRCRTCRSAQRRTECKTTSKGDEE